MDNSTQVPQNYRRYWNENSSKFEVFELVEEGMLECSFPYELLKKPGLERYMAVVPDDTNNPYFRVECKCPVDAIGYIEDIAYKAMAHYMYAVVSPSEEN